MVEREEERGTHARTRLWGVFTPRSTEDSPLNKAMHEILNKQYVYVCQS